MTSNRRIISSLSWITESIYSVSDVTEDRRRTTEFKDKIHFFKRLAAKELRDLISQDAGAFLNGSPQSDDQTLLIIHAV